jgi:hypothetical protein
MAGAGAANVVVVDQPVMSMGGFSCGFILEAVTTTALPGALPGGVTFRFILARMAAGAQCPSALRLSPTEQGLPHTTSRWPCTIVYRTGSGSSMGRRAFIRSMKAFMARRVSDDQTPVISPS